MIKLSNQNLRNLSPLAYKMINLNEKKIFFYLYEYKPIELIIFYNLATIEGKELKLK